MDFNVWTVLVLFAAVIAVGAILCFRLISNRRQRMAAIAAFAYLAFAAALFYIDVVQFEQGWAVPIYVACFVLVPIAVYYVAYTLGKPDEGAASWGRDGAHSKKKDRKQEAAAPVSPDAHREPARISVEPLADVSAVAEKRKAPAPSQPRKARQDVLPVTDELRGLLKDKVQILQQREGETRNAGTGPLPAAAPRKQRASVLSDSERPDAKTVPIEAEAVVRGPYGSEIAPVEQGERVPGYAVRTASPAARVAAKAAEREAGGTVEETAFEPEEPRAIETAAADREVAHPAGRLKAVRDHVESIHPAPSVPAQKPCAPDAAVGAGGSEPASDKAAATAMTYDRCFAKAASLKQKGVFVVAARLFEQSAALADDPKDRTKALFEEISCYVKEGDEDNALIKAADMRERTELARAEQIKLDAMLSMLAGIQV